MPLVKIFVLSLCAFGTFVTSSPLWTSQNAPSIVKTSSGQVQPLLDPTYPNVYQYLGVPFAQPPVDQLRFAPPQTVKPGRQILNATKLPPGCYQGTSPRNIFDVYEPGFNFLGEQSEDCLKLNIYRPTNTTEKLLPVLIFVYGGGFVTGATNETYEIPTEWVQAKQNLIIVNIQYRLNIFGFPNSAALQENNSGLQDIRFAVQWVHDNIRAFGGDAQKMTLWGQSAGSIAVNAWTYSYLDDPIVSGTISTSGVALTPREGWQSSDYQQTNFSYVAEQLGCSGNSSTQLECMRLQPAAAISDFINHYNGSKALTFRPVVDNSLVFANYTERLLQGKVVDQPAILGTNRREGERSIDKTLSPSGPNQTLALAYTAAAFLCPAELTTRLRHQAGRPTYRYEYKGNFSNISPLPWMGAYHASPLPLLFGTTNVAAAHPYSNESTRFELAVGSHMQDLWHSFVADPYHLEASADWPLNQGGSVNETTDAVKLIPGATEGQLSSIEYGGRREEYCAEIDPYLITQSLPPQFETALAGGDPGNL